jgi:hypothetical protein
MGQWLVKKGTNRGWDLIPYPQFEDSFRPFAEKIKKELHADSYVHYGPFGLNCENSFYWEKGFYKTKKDRNGNPEPKTVGGIEFISREHSWAIRNRRKKVHNYSETSIAGMNGENYEVIPIDNKLTHKKLMRLIKMRG